jgi:hypothetical protein
MQMMKCGRKEDETKNTHLMDCVQNSLKSLIDRFETVWFFFFIDSRLLHFFLFALDL